MAVSGFNFPLHHWLKVASSRNADVVSEFNNKISTGFFKHLFSNHLRLSVLFWPVLREATTSGALWVSGKVSDLAGRFPYPGISLSAPHGIVPLEEFKAALHGRKEHESIWAARKGLVVGVTPRRSRDPTFQLAFTAAKHTLQQLNLANLAIYI